MEQTPNSSSPARSGVRLVGTVINVGDVEYRTPFTGTGKSGKEFTKPAHYECVVNVLAGDIIVRAVHQWDDPMPARESMHTPALKSGQPVDIPIAAVGAVTKGIWTVYVEVI